MVFVGHRARNLRAAVLDSVTRNRQQDQANVLAVVREELLNDLPNSTVVHKVTLMLVVVPQHASQRNLDVGCVVVG